MRNYRLKLFFIRYLLMLAFAGIMVTSAFSQIKITGTVTDADDHSPLPGVNIHVKGTSTGTITDNNGKFNFEVSEKNAVLVFSFVGYETTEVVIQGDYSGSN